MNENYRTILAEYQTWLDTLGYSENLVHAFPKQVSYFFEWLHTQGVCQITGLNQRHVSEYFTYLEKRPNKQKNGTLGINYLNKNFYAVDKLLEFLNQKGMQNAPSPTKYRITPDKIQAINKINPLTQSEVKELLGNIENSFPSRPFLEREAKHYQLKLVFALYYGCGLRRSEGQKLTFDDVDFDKRTIFVKQGKNYKDRIVPMSEGVYRELQNYIYNFRNRQKLNHNRLFIHVPNYLLKSLKHLQGISENEALRTKKLTLHLLRHSIATHLLQNGMSVENIAQFLGHGGLEATQMYTHIVERK